MEEVGTKTLVAKLAEACDAVGGVEKKGVNETQRYKYQRAADVAMAMRHELFERGIIILPDEKESEHIVIETVRDGKTSRQTEARIGIDYHIMGHGGEIVIHAYGVARDSGDKAIWKAKTGALKYLLRGLGLIPDEKEDSEYDKSRGRDPDEEEDERVEIAGLIAQETESDDSRWLLFVTEDKKQLPVRMDKRSSLSKRLLVGYQAVVKGIPFQKDSRTAYSLTDVMWIDKEPTRAQEPVSAPPSAKKHASKMTKAGEATIGTGSMNIQLQQARKRTSIPDDEYYTILYHEGGVEHGPDIKVVDYQKIFKLVSEYKLAINDDDQRDPAFDRGHE